LVVIGGIVIALLAVLITRFFAKNVSSNEQWAAFNAQQASAIQAGRTAERKPLVISPTLEPFVISIGGFLVVFALASMFVTPPAEKTAASGQATPAAASGLTVTKDAAGADMVLATLPKGNADTGVKLYTSQACSGCHSLQKDQRLVGPSFYGLWGRAATRKPGYGAKEYLYESIVNPNALVLEGFQPNLMPPTLAKTLNPQSMADLLAYIERDHNEK
jgi:cytochrome c551/c552